MKGFKSRLNTAYLPLLMAARLGKKGSLQSRIQILYRGYQLLWLIAIGRRSAIALSVYVNNEELPLHLESSADLAVIREILLDQEYRHDELHENAVIFDVGANIGVASLYFHALYPQAKIYAFEPDPILFGRLQKHVQQFSNITPFQIALTDTDGEIEFYSSPDRPLSGSIIQRQKEEKGYIVASNTLSGIMRQLGVSKIDLLKFDIEGGEYRLLSSREDRNRIQQMVGEVHLDLVRMSLEEFTELLSEFSCTYPRRTAQNRYILHASLLSKSV
jgi:FkbM family methyltransferase